MELAQASKAQLNAPNAIQASTATLLAKLPQQETAQKAFTAKEELTFQLLKTAKQVTCVQQAVIALQVSQLLPLVPTESSITSKALEATMIV